MGAYWSGTKPPQLAAKYQQIITAVGPNAYNSAMIDEMSKVQIEEVRQARAYTESRPSPKSGRTGRVDSGKMRDSIVGETKLTKSGLVTNRVGFLAGREAYFKYQTSTGFVNNRSGDFIEPTLALKDAHEDAKPNLRQAGINVIRKLSAAFRRIR